MSDPKQNPQAVAAATGGKRAEQSIVIGVNDSTILELPDTCAEAAHYWLEFGLRPIPLDNATKTTTRKWDKWLHNLTHATITTYWKNHPEHDVGAIVDDALFIVDADTQEAVARLIEIEQSLDIEPNMIHKTSKGEHHFFRRAPGTFAMMKSYSSEGHPEKLDIRTGRGEDEGRSMIVLPPSSGKEVILCEAESVEDLVEVDQVFIDAIFKHNGEEPPRPVEPKEREESRREVSQSEAAEILSYITPDCGYEDWLTVLMGVHDKFSGDDVGLELVDQWSAQGKDYPGYEEIEYKWRSFSSTTLNPITFATVCKIAEGAGADLKEIKSHYDADGNRKRTYQEMLDSAREMTPETLPEEIEALARETIGLSIVEREKVLKAMKKATEVNLAELRQLVGMEKRETRRKKLTGNTEVKRIAPMPPEYFPDISFNDETGVTKVLPTIPNIRAMLDHYRISASYDVIAKKTKVIVPGLSGSPDNVDNSSLTQVISLAKLNGIPSEQVPSYVQAIADERQVNPVADWITSKPWDGVNRVTSLLNTLVLTPCYPQKLRDTLVSRWLISAVAAALKPIGFKARGVLTLQGAQSIGKTSWLQSLVPDPALRERLVKTDHLLDPNNKDSILGAVSHWLVELGELDGSFRKSDVSRIKGFITADMDKIRRPYDRLEAEYQRRTVFFASVNDAHFLVDETGNTRFWTIAVDSVNFNHGLDMQQIWAEVVTWYESGFQWWLTPQEEREIEAINKGHRVASSVRELILASLDFDQPSKAGWQNRTASEVLIGVGFDRPTNGQAREAGVVLREVLGSPTKSKGVVKWLVPPLPQRL